MNIKPLFDRVLLLPEESEKETKSGIILPTAAQEKSQIATVIAVGQGGEVDGKKIAVCDILAGEEIKKASIWDYVKKIM